MARLRSPNYPAMSLPSAIERARVLHKVERQNAMAREAVVRHLGFTSLNGASATVLSALSKYGLLDSTGDGEARVSDLAMKSMVPHDDNERQKAVQEAAFRPALFQELRDKWPDHAPSDATLRPYLIRKGFSETALDQVIRFYRETIDIVGVGHPGHDSPPEAPNENVMPSAAAHQPQTTGAGSTAAAPPAALIGGRPFNLAYDGAALSGQVSLKSARDVNALVKYLNAHKAYLDAIAEDEAFDTSNDDDGEAL